MGTTILTTVLVPDELSGTTMLPYVTAARRSSSVGGKVTPMNRRAAPVCQSSHSAPASLIAYAVRLPMHQKPAGPSPVLGTRRS